MVHQTPGTWVKPLPLGNLDSQIKMSGSLYMSESQLLTTQFRDQAAISLQQPVASRSAYHSRARKTDNKATRLSTGV
jgi:hypothetical protein